MVTAAAALVAGLTSSAPAASASTGAAFAANTVWHGTFAGPSVLRVGSTYWAYSTTYGGDNLPVLHSNDLRTWVTRAAYPSYANPGWWAGYNDAMPHPARWALYYIHRNGRDFASIWGPDVEYIGGRYVLTYAISYQRVGRHCISIATSSRPDGPFVDNTTGPIVCSPDPNGSIDPQLVKDSAGTPYLVWKDAGVRGSKPTIIWSRRLNSSGTAFAAGSRPAKLLYTVRPWEGTVIENPAMIKYGSRWYLFYSGNAYTTPSYATGYALCSGPLGPCRRPTTPGPLLATGGSVAGPGGADPFVTPKGGFRLAYAAWDLPFRSAEEPVRMHVALLSVDSRGYLHVLNRG
ncbi:glycoside hydrolase family 43 protein [Jatrophihabitans sp.]|uniref:glycoside hydrolase family 43 protein n=1 Tax=Jatrophihabitans sp. TaxID=1932789 RepID=UPI003F7DBEF2